MNDTVSVSQRMISADFLTPSYRIVGKIIVGHTGVMGMMNDATTSFMEILDAKLARVHMPTKLVGDYKMMELVKSQVFAVCLPRREDLGPAALARGGYVSLLKYPLRVATPVYELDGTLEWVGRFDFATVMVEGVREFVPLYDTTLTATLTQTLKIESPAVLFNRRQVDWLGLDANRKES